MDHLHDARLVCRVMTGCTRIAAVLFMTTCIFVK